MRKIITCGNHELPDETACDSIEPASFYAFDRSKIRSLTTTHRWGKVR
jgi:hypothetical protein